MTFPSLLMGILTLLIGYLLGSFPSGYIAGIWLADLDLRKVGSGSTGATNVLRHIGKWPALFVFLIDLFKGMIPVLIAKYFLLNDYLQVLSGLAAITGHIWPIWLNWKGGKAVATGLGILLGLKWSVGITCFAVFLTVFSFSKVISLSSIVASISLPLIMLFSFRGSDFRTAYLLLSLITMLMVLWRHRSNFQRLLAGKEPKVGQSN